MWQRPRPTIGARISRRDPGGRGRTEHNQSHRIIAARARGGVRLHRKSLKGSARRSRTEQFLEWAEENPDELVAIQQAEADRALKELLKEQRELDRTVRSAKRYHQSPEELARLLADLPF